MFDAIESGDTVKCVLPPALNKHGQPEQRPELGKEYVVTEIYPTDYGQGCKLEEMDPFPYEGYVLYASPFNSLNVAGGWYFEKVITG